MCFFSSLVIKASSSRSITSTKIKNINLTKSIQHTKTRIFCNNFYIQWDAKVLNTLLIAEFSKYYMIHNCQTWLDYSNITGFFPDNRLMNEKDYFFIDSEIFKITLRESFGHIQFFIDFFVISLRYCIQVAFIMFKATAQPSKTHHITL